MTDEDAREQPPEPNDRTSEKAISSGFRRAGPAALYIDVSTEPSPATAQLLGAWRRALDTHRIADIYEVIPSYRSLLIEHRPGIASERVLRWALEHRPDAEQASTGAVHQLAVAYGDQADREALEARLGLEFDEIVRRHAETEYTVAFLGFTPGFPYLLGLPPELHTPRRDRPRERTPAGSVAIAGAQAGIYPSASPGGWWVLGRTGVTLFDASADPPALLAPGDRVRFEQARVDRPHVERVDSDRVSPAPERSSASEASTDGRAHGRASPTVVHLTVRKAWPRCVSLQAGPRRNAGHWGLAEAGALDHLAYARANDIVGNLRGAAALEAIGQPLTLTATGSTRAAITGGGLSATVDGQPVRRWAAFDWPDGGVLELVPDRHATGYTTYLALAGGFAADMYMESASTDARAGVGGIGRYVQSGDVLRAASHQTSSAGQPHVGTPRYPERVVLGIHPGPQFSAGAWAALLGSSFQVGVLDRTGARLAGPAISFPHHQIVSEGSPAGAVQVPPDGQPIVLLADRGRTGGYGKPAIVDPRDLWRLAQARPGTEIWFEAAHGADSGDDPLHWEL